MGARYRLRRNLLSYQVEWQPVEGDGPGGRVDDHFVNSLWRSMQLEGIHTDVNMIHTLLASDFVGDYHPFREWIEQLPPWDGETDYIGRFFSMVHCRHTTVDEFDHYARRWLVALVASVLSDEAVNQEILTFIGPQGSYKSSFMQHILPPHLRRFFTTKANCYSLDKDDLIMLAENILISLEEIHELNRRNRQFEAPNPAEELIVTHCIAPRSPGEESCMASFVTARVACVATFYNRPPRKKFNSLYSPLN